MRSLDIGATGMLAQQLNVDVISNNIANMTTTGFKRRRAAFQDLIYQNKIDIGYLTSHVFQLEAAADAYDMIMEKSKRRFLCLLELPDR